jgi:threonine dehydrogenase-like Zn-dependent dehydrogenase
VGVGAKANGYRNGDLISFSPSGDEGSAPTGIASHWGGHCSLHLVRSGNFPVVLPAGMDPLRYAATQIAAISLRGVRMAAPKPREVAVVVGQGVIGACSAAWLKAAGCRVIVTDLAPSRCQRAERHWADAAVCGRDADAAERILALCAGVGADIVVEASGSAAGCELAHRFLRCTPVAFYHNDAVDEVAWPRLVYQASYLKTVPITPSAWLPGEGVRCFAPRNRNADDTRRSVQGFVSGAVDGLALIDQVVPAAQAPTIYRTLLDRPDDIFSAVFRWSSL